jgi:hypothetical protein
MSLIASTFAEQSPFLIGDLLFSSKDGNKDFLLPTHAETGESVADLKPQDLAQKIFILKDNVCVALAGLESEMKALLDHLRDSFRFYDIVTRDSVHTMLHSFDLDNQFKHSAFIILVMEKDEAGNFFGGKFTSNSNWIEIEHPTFASVVAGGRGARDFINHLQQPATYASTFEDDLLKSRLTANIIMLSQWITTEKVTGRNLENLWGGGYEIIFFDGERFAKFPEIAFVVFETKIDPDGTMQRMHPSVINYYKYQGDLLLIYSFQLFRGSIEEKEGRLQMIAEAGDYESHLFFVPPFDTPAGTLLEVPSNHSFETRHVAAGMCIWYENSDTFRPGAYMEANEVGLKFTENGKLEVSMSLEVHNSVEENARAQIK